VGQNLDQKMQISNPLEMNDWQIHDFLGVVLAVQFILWGTILLERAGVAIPIVPQLIGFIYLTYIPGILILRCLRFHKLGTIRTTLFAVGLSLAFLMFVGLFCNFVYPFFGYTEPLSLVALMTTISVIVVALCVVSYAQDKTFSDRSTFDVRELLSAPTLLLCLIPFLAIFGTHAINVYQNNLILGLLIVGIAVIPVLIALDRFFTPKHYPLAVFVITLALLYHTSLISRYLWGWDVNHEYALAQVVLQNSLWNPYIADNMNAMLSVTILPVWYARICALSLTWVFKTVYPFICALVPLGLFLVFEKQTDRKTSFFATFFFVSLYSFFVEQVELARQEIAVLFLVLFVLLIEDKDVSSRIKVHALLLVFGTTLVISHYGLTYLFLVGLFSAFLALAISNGPLVQRGSRKRGARSKVSRTQASPDSVAFSTSKHRNLSARLVLLFFVTTFAWYMSIGSASPLSSLIHIGASISGTLFGSGPAQTPEGLVALAGGTLTPLYQLARSISNVSDLLIALGLLAVIVRFCKKHFSETFLGFSVANFAFMIAGVAVPYFASSLNIARLYQIALVFLAPFVVIGWFTVVKVLHNALKAPFTKKRIKGATVLLSFFLATVLLFNTGFVYQVAGAPPTSVALSTKIDYPVFNDRENAAASWLYAEKDSTRVWADNYRSLLLNRFDISLANVTTDVSAHGTYAFLGTRNVMQMKFTVRYSTFNNTNVTGFDLYGRIAGNESRIYDNGGAQVYKPKSTAFTLLP
jgi:uncharacterized membrane protein